VVSTPTVSKETTLEHLFAPLTLGDWTVPNRIAFAAHTTNLTVNGVPSQRQAQYYARRAEGGAGLIVVEEASVHPSDRPYQRVPRGYDPAICDGYALIADAVHEHGAVALAQLNHSGMQGTGHIQKRALWAPSAIPNPATIEMPMVMEEEHIAAVVAGFALAARHAVMGGLAGVEINAGQYSLLRQFLSPLTNQREDRYGGDLEGRLRLSREVIAAVRSALDNGPIVGLRLSADEFAPWAGITPDQAPEIARALTESGDVDYVSVTVGSIYTTHMTRAGMHTEQGYALDPARKVREVVAVPVYGSGSLVSAEMAAEAIANGAIDGAEMTRALIADPDLPRKVRSGQADRVRPCIRCNQDCYVRIATNPIVSCIHNPAAGHESDAPSHVAVAQPRRVIVVGGGPAGMNAARVAALRGHEVTLFEREARLGGTPLLIATAPQREAVGQVSDWLRTELATLAVAVRCNTVATADAIAAAQPDAVIVATGARMRMPEKLSGTNAVPVMGAREILSGAWPEMGQIVIVDIHGGYPAIDTAQTLAVAGYPVTIVTEDVFVSSQLGASGEFNPWYQRAAALGISLRPLTTFVAAESDRVIVRHRFGTQEEEIAGVTAVVWVDHDLPDDALFYELAARLPEVSRIGDCLAPRRILHAIMEADRIGGVV
jgi:mycofactocin system FadH/OYE family oxidoreductase 2